MVVASCCTTTWPSTAISQWNWAGPLPESGQCSMPLAVMLANWFGFANVAV